MLSVVTIYRKFLLFVALVFCLLNYTKLAVAVESNKLSESLAFNLDQQLLDIKKLTDKNQALKRISEILTFDTLSPEERLYVLTMQGDLYHQSGKLDNAIESAKTAQQFANKYHLKQFEADAYKKIGVYAYFKGNNSLALNAYQQSLKYYITVNDPIAQANLYNNIALVYGSIGKLADSLSNYQLAEPLYQKYGSEKDQIDVHSNIALLHSHLKRYDIAISMFKDVIEKRKSIGDEDGIAKTYGDLGISYQHAGDYQKALYFMTKSLDYFYKHNDDYNVSQLLHNLSELYIYLNNIDKAIEYAKEGINKSKEQGHDMAYVGCLYTLAQAYFIQGKLDLALNNVKLSNELSKEMHYKEQIKYNLSLLSLIFSAKNQPLKATKVHREFLQVQMEMTNDELNGQLALFDSELLKQQVEQLKQQKRLHVLEVERAEQERNFTITAIIFVLIFGFLIIRRDITHRTKLALESQVKKRTTELEYLMQELQNANNIKSQFLANMSHEIRTPLTTVIGQAEAIICGDVDENFITKEVEIIHGNSLHLLELTNNILDLSKIEANKIDLELQKLDLHDILLELANMFTLQATSKGLIFEINHHLPSPFIIEIDAFRVKQILINLCANAVKFTHKGHVKLNISQNVGQLVFKITDSGIGMSNSQLHNLFASFTQGDSSINRRFGGSGLGLCLSDQLAKIMGGTIEVESELNQGSIFVFSLPCTICVEEFDIEKRALVSDNNSKEKESKINHHLQGSILLADDHSDNRRLIARLLTSLGLNVFTASNGSETIALYEKYKPSLILMDIQMPEMDGVEAFEILRQKGYAVPIIALTANAMSHEIENYLLLGFDGHLSKPIEKNIFITTVSQYYDGNFSLETDNDSFEQLDMSDLVQEFKSNLVLEQQDLILHINHNEIDKLAKLSHRIAGAAQMFGFADLSRYALQLEMSINNKQTNHINDYTQDLLNEIDHVLW